MTVNGNTYTSAYDSGPGGTGPPTVTQTSPAARTRTLKLDASGRVTSVAAPGIDTVSLSYDSNDRLYQTTQGSGALQRTSTWGYYSTGTGREGQLSTVTGTRRQR